jgi:uncharacterized protein
MLLDVSTALKAPGIQFDFSFTEKWEPISVGGEEIRFDQPVEASGNFVYTGENFLINGRLDAHYIVSCCRCLKDVASEMSVDFDEEFVKTEDEEHPDRYLYRGDKISLDPMIGDLLSLNTPMRHLCNESCRGLCPECGADRNTTDCHCHGGPDGETPYTAF